MLEGKPSDLPARPKFVEGWQLGQPDLILKAAKPYMLAASGIDQYWNFILPVPIDGPRWVRAVEIHPGDKRLVHHANILVDRYESARRMEKGKGGGLRRHGDQDRLGSLRSRQPLSVLEAGNGGDVRTGRNGIANRQGHGPGAECAPATVRQSRSRSSRASGCTSPTNRRRCIPCCCSCRTTPRSTFQPVRAISW